MSSNFKGYKKGVQKHFYSNEIFLFINHIFLMIMITFSEHFTWRFCCCLYCLKATNINTCNVSSTFKVFSKNSDKYYYNICEGKKNYDLLHGRF